MKFHSSQYNPLKQILQYLPIKQLTAQDIDYIASCLNLGGIECENKEEAVECINTLAELKVLKVSTFKENNIIYYNIEAGQYGK